MAVYLYASILGILYITLSLAVIKARRIKKVPLLDGGDKDLARLMRVHGNFAEYVPFSLLLIYLVEHSNGYVFFANLAGILLVVGRLVHAYGVLIMEMKPKPVFKGRVAGMAMTFTSIVISSLCLLIRFIFE